MKALSIKQPWASLIAHGIKDIENRTWKTNFRGRIYIHASGTPSKEPYMIFTDEQFGQIEESNFDLKVFEAYEKTSQIIGEVDIVDCVINHPSIWAEQTIYEIDKYENYKEYAKPIYNWVLANPVLYENPILNVKGKLSFWDFATDPPSLITSLGDMLFLINSIRVTDQYISDIYLNGGCYQFHLMLKKFAPDCEARITKDKNHIVTFFKGKHFDITGIVEGQFEPLSQQEIEMVSKWSFAKNKAIQICECPVCEEPIIV